MIVSFRIFTPPLALLVMAVCALAGCSDNPPAAAYGFYRFDDNLAHAVAQEGPDGTQPAGGVHFRFNEAAAGWSSLSGQSEISSTDSTVVLTSKEADALASPKDLSINGATTDYVLLKMSVAGPSHVKLKWHVKGIPGFETHRVLRIQVPKQGEMLLYRLRLADIKAWRHREIDQVFLAVESPARLEVEFLDFLDRRSDFTETAGVVQCAVGDRVRPTLYAHCPAKLKYRVKAPARAAFSAGLGIIEQGRPVTFELLVEADGLSRMFTAEVGDTQQWKDTQFDLSEFAGKNVDISLAATCIEPGQIALWSSPVLFERYSEETTSRPPNVLVYVIDCLRADHLDAYGYGRPTAPAMLELSRQGVKFDRCFSQDTWTKPSMTSLAAGVDQFYHGIEQYGDILSDGLVTLPEILRGAGYQTCVISENPHTPPETTSRPAYDYLEPLHLRVELSENKMRWRDLPKITYETASAFIETHRDRPFFLYVHTMEAHDIRNPDDPNDKSTYDPPEAYRDRWVSEGGATAMDLYDCSVAYADDNLRRMLARLDELKLANDTLVILTGDHGEAFGEHEGYFTHYWKPFNTLTHVPLLMRLPGRLPAARVVPENVQLIDLGPTILALAGLPAIGQFQGKDLAPLILGKSARDYQGRLVVSQWYGWVGAVLGDWKLMYDLNSQQATLFDLSKDMLESTDISGQNPRVVSDLKAQVLAHIDRQTALRNALAKDPEMSPVVIDPALQEQLESLGYGDKEKKNKKGTP